MKNPHENSRYCVALLLVAGGSALGAIANAADAPPTQIPTCDRKIGTLAVTEPQNQWWTALNLESPAALIKVFVSQSKCFTLVDRGKGLQAAQAERALSASGEERQGSNIGKGQMKAADYVLIPDIANQNRNADRTNIGGVLGGLLPHGVGALVGGVSMKSKTADVVLTLTDVRSTEQVALGNKATPKKPTLVGWAVAVAAGSSAVLPPAAPAAMPIRKLAKWSPWLTSTRMSNGRRPEECCSRRQSRQCAAIGQDVQARQDVHGINLKSQVVRDVDPGMMLYPTGDKMGVWWKVTDELGNEGWVVSTNFQLAH